MFTRGFLCSVKMVLYDGLIPVFLNRATVLLKLEEDRFKIEVQRRYNVLYHVTACVLSEHLRF